MVAYSWEQLKENVVFGKTHLSFTREQSMQEKYHSARAGVSIQGFKKYSDYIKIKHLQYNTMVCQDNKLSSRKTKNSLCTLLIENEYPYEFAPEDNIKHYMIWALTPLSSQEIRSIMINSIYSYIEYVWFENDDANKSIKDLWHCHIMFKVK